MRTTTITTHYFWALIWWVRLRHDTTHNAYIYSKLKRNVISTLEICLTVLRISPFFFLEERKVLTTEKAMNTSISFSCKPLNANHFWKIWQNKDGTKIAIKLDLVWKVLFCVCVHNQYDNYHCLNSLAFALLSYTN